MKNILFIALCLISLSGICQVKDSIVGDTHYIVFPTGTSTATTVNYIYQIPTYSQWAWEYYQTRTVAHSAISFNVLTCTGPPNWLWKTATGVTKTSTSATGDTIHFENVYGTAFPYIMLQVHHYGTDTATISTNRLIYKRMK